MGKVRSTNTESARVASRDRRIYEIVAAIPRGSVATYGQVAERAGLPRGARQVGRSLAACPTRLAWHRVVNAAGRISLPPRSAAYAEQVRRLQAEGVEVRSGRVALRRFGWQADDLDALLWGPGARRRPPRPAGTR